MTVQSIRGVGYCARMTEAGNWAFSMALDLAVQHDVKLDVFFFPTATSQPHDTRGRRGELSTETEERKIALEREVRLYYDRLLGEFLNVGFRLCEGDEEPELRRCLLLRKEYDVLVLAYEGHRCRFGQQTIEQFAENMPCPTILVGPERPEQLFLNSAAELYVGALGLQPGEWRRISEVAVSVE